MSLTSKNDSLSMDWQSTLGLRDRIHGHQHFTIRTVTMKLFVPGRICLLGEHSDWAGGYRRINADIEKGNALICGTNQGIFAEVEPHPTSLVLTWCMPGGKLLGHNEIPRRPRAWL